VGCGFVGQLGANSVMQLRRKLEADPALEKGETAVVPPPLLNTAVVRAVGEERLESRETGLYRIGSRETG
jgi:hypothetical protein